MKKRWLAITLATIMTFASAMPMTAMADDTEHNITVAQVESNEILQSTEISGSGTNEAGNTNESSNPDASEGSTDETAADTSQDTEIKTEENETKSSGKAESPNADDSENSADELSPNALFNTAAQTEKNEITAPVKAAKRIEASLSDDQKTITAAVYGSDEAATALQVAVWSEKNGQDDLKWVSATKAADGSWKADISVKGHKSTGNYFLHAYQTVNGKFQFLCANTITVSAPKAKVTADEESRDDINGTFKAVISDLNVPAGIKKVSVAIWGEKDGQNDLVWYTAVKEGDNYIVKADAGDHKYETGKYFIHCYITDGNDIQSFVGGTQTDVQYKKSLDADLSKDEKTIKVTAFAASRATALQVAVWSEKNGQDDLKWIPATKAADGSWKADISVKGHKSTGNYFLHAYQTVNGKFQFLCANSVTVSAPKAKVTADEESRDDVNGTFKAVISDLNVPAGVKKVSVAVWGEKNGQNDLIWYTPTKIGDDYVVNVAASRHKFETGRYFIHCYITDGNDILSYAGGTEQTVKIKSEGDLTIIKDSDQTNVAIRYTGAAGSKFSAAVWSEKNGQDDLKWYAFSADGTVIIPIKNHATAGKYYVHIYNGNKFVKGATFNIDSVKASEIKADNVNGNSGTFRLTVSGVYSASGVKNVSVPVWVGSDQSKIYWYDAKKASDGTYYVDVNVANHKYAFGTYTAHVYVYGNNGVWNFCCGTQVNIEADKYIYAESTGIYSERVWLVNPGNVSSVTFPTWSETNGQDDLKWYKGIKSGNAWYADVNSKNHLHSGSYITHCYADFGSGSTFVGATFYRLNYNAQANNTAKDKAYINSLLTYDSRPDVADFNIDYVRAAKNIVTNESIGYGHTWPKTISCAGLVGLTLTHLGYGDFIKNDPLGWGYIDLGTEYVNTLINEVGATWNPVTITGANCMYYLQPGDILYTYTNQAVNHIAIYAGYGKTIEARGPSGPTDADDSGYETGIYSLLAGGSYQGYFRIPAYKIHHI